MKTFGSAKSECLLPSAITNPEARTFDLTAFGIDCGLQLGTCHVRATRGSGLGLHRHDSYQITVCTHGSVSFAGKKRTWTLLPGRILVLPPGTEHRLTANTRGNVRYWFFLRFPAEGRRFLDLPPSECRWLRARLESLDRQLYAIPLKDETLLERMVSVVENDAIDDAEKRLRLRALTLRFLLALTGLKAIDERGGERIRPVIELMQNRPQDRYPTDELVAQTGLKATALAELFRRETGKTPHNYLVWCRVQKAKRMLAATKIPITRIAVELGFASSQHFALTFRLGTGKTPRQWREEKPQSTR